MSKISVSTLFPRRNGRDLNMLGHRSGTAAATIDDLVVRGGTVEEIVRGLATFEASKGRERTPEYLALRVRDHLNHLEKEKGVTFTDAGNGKIRAVLPAPKEAAKPVSK